MQAKNALLVVLLLLCALLGFHFWQVFKSPTRLPDLHFSSIKGEQLSLQQLRGKPVLVTFWATSCPSCIKDMAHLMTLYQRYHLQGLEIIAIAMPYDPPNYVVEMSKAKALPYPVVLDVHGDYVQAFGKVSLTPNSFLIAPDGQVALHQLGLLDMAQMQTLLEAFLPAPR